MLTGKFNLQLYPTNVTIYIPCLKSEIHVTNHIHQQFDRSGLSLQKVIYCALLYIIYKLYAKNVKTDWLQIDLINTANKG